MKQTLFSIKETAFNEIDCNTTDCWGCEHVVDGTCEGEPENCLQVQEWFDKLCDEHNGE